MTLWRMGIKIKWVFTAEAEEILREVVVAASWTDPRERLGRDIDRLELRSLFGFKWHVSVVYIVPGIYIII